MATERIHEPSPIQLLRAKNEGIAARSAELTRSLVICCVMGGILLLAGSIKSLFQANFQKTIDQVQVRASSVQATHIRDQAMELLLPFISFLAAIVVLALLAWNLQSPLFPNFKKAAPDWNRSFDPSRFFKLISLDRWLRAGTGLLMLIVLIGIGAVTILSQPEFLIRMMGMNLTSAFKMAGDFLASAMVGTGIALVTFGFVDYLLERIRIYNQQKMTDQEKRDEARENEPHPALRRSWIRESNS